MAIHSATVGVAGLSSSPNSMSFERLGLEGEVLDSMMGAVSW